MNLKWKVCGMRDPVNIAQVLSLEPDYMGFIFYEKSPRYVGASWDGPGNDFGSRTKKVGVFVNQEVAEVEALSEQYHLDLLQLHGNESPEDCRKLSMGGYKLIKAMGLKEHEDMEKLDDYKPWVSYFLFDTPSDQYGGTGQSFNWGLLKNYDNELPFFLSGGISLTNIEEIKGLEGLSLAAIDVNSRFEVEPGLKNTVMLKKLKDKISEL